MSSILPVVRAVLGLAPLARPIIAELANAIRDNDRVAARKALEAALRLQFVARQR